MIYDGCRKAERWTGNLTLQLLVVWRNHSFSRRNRLQHHRVSVALLIALWNPNSPRAELFWIQLRSTAKKPSTGSQETCESFTKEPGLNAVGSGDGWLFQLDKPNQREREQMAFSYLSVVRVLLAWVSLPRHLCLVAFCHRKLQLTQWPTVRLDGLGFLQTSFAMLF